MKKAIRTAIAFLIAAVMVFAFAACNKADNTAGTAKTAKATESDQFETATDNDEMECISADGWRVVYNAKDIEAMEVDEHADQFVYVGESAGTNMVEIRYIKDKQPEEVLYDLTSTWTNDQEEVKRSEGIFPGTDDKWGYWRELPASEDGSRLGQTAIAGEFNGGVLLFTVTSHMSGDEETDMAVSDAISGVIDSITYPDGFKDQTMYSYFPGTYNAAKGNKAYKSVVLKKDHTGVITDAKGKKTNILWGSIELTDTDNNKDIEYTIEGDDLMMKVGNDWFEFSK